MHATTPFLHLTKTFPEQRLPATFAPELFELRGRLPYELTPQFLTCDTEHVLRAAELLPSFGSAALELNCGCPTPNGAGKNAGSGILQDPDAFGYAIDKLTRDLGPRRLAIKMRLGISAADEMELLIEQIAQLPLARLTIHGRTRADKYRGVARWDKIDLAARATATPTWASGDVFNASAFQRLVEVAPSIAGVVIGRGLMHNPWIFEELRMAQPVSIDPLTLLNALSCYAMLHEVWLTSPEKLMGRVLSGRIGEYCGTGFESWEKLSVNLSSMLGMVPFVLFDAKHVPEVALSPTSFRRFKVLWSYLRSSLPEVYQVPRLMRTKTFTEFLLMFFELSAELPGDAKELKIIANYDVSLQKRTSDV